MGEHSWHYSCPPPRSLGPGAGPEVEEHWSTERHTIASPTDAYGTVDFEDTAARVCRAKVGWFGTPQRSDTSERSFSVCGANRESVTIDNS